MKAVPATTGARRTVRLAVALVAGQAVLVAVIGWVTLSRADSGHGGAHEVAAPPGRALPAVVPPGPPPSAKATKSTNTTSPASPGAAGKSGGGGGHRRTGGNRPATTPEVVPAAPETTDDVGTATPAPIATASSGFLALVPLPSPATTPTSAGTPAPSATEGPVHAGRPCADIFAVARADDGRRLVCLPGSDHQLRWKIV